MTGLPCRFCGGATRVVKSRPYTNQIWRRRRCLVESCGKRFTTREFWEPTRRRIGKQPYGRDWRTRAAAVRARDGNMCRVCKKQPAIGKRFAIDHIVPLRISKCHDLDNLITLCRQCHSGKTGAERMLRSGDREGFIEELRVKGWDMVIVARAFTAWAYSLRKSRAA